MKALKWVDTASPEQIAEAVPTEYHLGDKPLYLKAVANSKEAYSKTGMIGQEGKASIMDMLQKLDPELQNAKVDLSMTFDERFARRASV
jgi:NitT/TauT family transport system substrate-binding protein